MQKEEEEDFQQPIFGIGGSWGEWEGYLDIMQWVKAYLKSCYAKNHFQNPCYPSPLL